MKSNNSKRANEFIDYLKSKGFSSKSIEVRVRIVQLFWKWLDKENLEVESITYSDLLLYIKYRNRKGTSQRSIQNYMGVIKHFYDQLIKEEKLIENPVSTIEIKGVKRKVLYHILEPLELQALYNGYKDESLKGSRNQVMLGLLVYQGLKTEEIAMLEVNHIKLREGQIDVPGGKKSSHRMMKLEAHQVMDMYDYILKIRPEILTLSKQETDRLLVSPSGGTQISNFMTRLMVQLKKINPSVLNAKQIRASVITKWLKNYNLREVQYLAGHRYISSTESYLENDLEGLQEEVQQFHPLG